MGGPQIVYPTNTTVKWYPGKAYRVHGPDGTFYGVPGGLVAENPSLIPSGDTNPYALWYDRAWWDYPVYSWDTGASSEPVVGPDGTIIVGLENGYDPTFLLGLNPTNGSIVWIATTTRTELCMEPTVSWPSPSGNIYAADFQSVSPSHREEP